MRQNLALIRLDKQNTLFTLTDAVQLSGIANIILWQQRFEAQRRIVMAAPMIGVTGIVQREGEVIHIIGERLEDQSALLHSVGQMHFPPRFGPADAASNGGGRDPRDGPRPLPQETIRVKSRDFH